jgi:hypothetical protein
MWNIQGKKMNISDMIGSGFVITCIVFWSAIIIYGYRKRIPPFRNKVVVFGFPVLAALLLLPIFIN